MRVQSNAKLYAPKCSHPNCSNQVGFHKSYTKKNGSPGWKWKTFCDPHRTTLKSEADVWMSQGCENRNGYLGWFCKDPYSSLGIDHHDGDKRNTSPDNLKILCANCHGQKTMIFGDNRKRYTYTNPNFSKFFEEV